jgi:hypothetical protein
MNITKHLTECVISGKPVAFVKFGDGEYYCMFGCNWATMNSDFDKYTNHLKTKLIESFKNIVCNVDNAYIGCWNEKTVNYYYKSLVPNEKMIKWGNYNSIIIENVKDEVPIQDKIELWKTVKHSKIKKIIICNKLLEKAKILLNIDYVINIPLNSWFDTCLDELLETIKTILENNEQYIIITCGGMGIKVVVSELLKIYPNNIYLDFGSGLDLICTKKDSRSYRNYEEYVSFFQELLPENWNDMKYEYIYPLAEKILGQHLHKK